MEILYTGKSLNAYNNDPSSDLYIFLTTVYFNYIVANGKHFVTSSRTTSNLVCGELAKSSWGAFSVYVRYNLSRPKGIEPISFSFERWHNRQYESGCLTVQIN